MQLGYGGVSWSTNMANKITALSHSKHRNMIGFVGIEVDMKQLVVNVRLAKQWKRSQINEIPQEISDAYSQIKWDRLYIDQMAGEHFIKDIKRKEVPVDVITTKKNLDEPGDIDRLIVMDKIEMTQLMLALKLKHRIQFPKEPSGTMKDAISQVELFTEKKTEAGGIDYYAPGEELDCLTKSLMICCFAVRNILAGDDGIPVMGPVRKKALRSIGDYRLILNKRGLSSNDL